MRPNVASIDCAFQAEGRAHRSRIQYPESRQALAVLCMTPGGGFVSPGTVKGVCEDIPGIEAVRVDADRGRIHVLYDGTELAIGHVKQALCLLGLCIRHLEQKPCISTCASREST